MIQAATPFCRRAFVIVALLPRPSISPAALPGGEDPKAYTEHDYRRQLLEFNTRTIVGAYKDVGKRDRKWDDSAIRLLEAMAQRMTYAKAEWFYDVPERMP